MIHAYGRPDPPVPRLLASLVERGHVVKPAAAPEGRRWSTLVLTSGGDLDPMGLGVLLGAWRSAPGARVLVMSRLGAHPDARVPDLKRLWEIEEHARASGLPVVTLRLAPLLGPQSPLWLKLRQRPRLPHGGRQLLNPVAEADVVEAMDRLLHGGVAWEGWFEVAGPEVLSLKDLAALAVGAGPAPPGGEAAWEPPLRELEAQRLAEASHWLEHFGIGSRSLSERAREWKA